MIHNCNGCGLPISKVGRLTEMPILSSGVKINAYEMLCMRCRMFRKKELERSRIGISHEKSG